MTRFETEEQQVEALKRWWKENGTAVIIGVVLAVGALGGWRGWSWYQASRAFDASDAYAVVHGLLQQGDARSFEMQAEALRDRFASSPYAVLTALQEAKMHAAKGDLPASAESLDWVIRHSEQKPVRDIARLRLARVLLADDRPDDAYAVIDREFSGTFVSLAHEIRGDILVAKGELEQARREYDEAMKSGQAAGVEFLQMKRNDLGN